MKKLEELLDKRNSELESERKAREAKINALNSKKQETIFKLIASIVLAMISYNLGIVHWDGGLFTGFFMQLLLIASGIATIVFIGQFLILLTKSIDN